MDYKKPYALNPDTLETIGRELSVEFDDAYESLQNGDGAGRFEATRGLIES